MALFEVQVAEFERAQHVRKQTARFVLAGDRAVAREMRKEVAADAKLHRNAHFTRRGKGLDEAHNVRMARGTRRGNLAIDALWVRDQRAVKAFDGDLRSERDRQKQRGMDI